MAFEETVAIHRRVVLTLLTLSDAVRIPKKYHLPLPVNEIVREQYVLVLL